MPHLPVYLTVPVFLLLVLADYWFDQRRSSRTYTFAGALSNLSVGIVETAFGVFSHLAILVAYEWQYHFLALGQWSVHNPVIWILGFLLYELCYYWKHRLGHEINFMWAGHAVHHHSQEMNFSTGLRLSGTSPLYDIIFYVPMALLGVPPLVYLTCKAISLSYQLFLHTERVGRLPAWVEFLLNTPSHHRVHHSCHQQHLDRNYGSVLILYDRLFGTFTPEHITPVYGTTKPVGSFNPITVNLLHYHMLLNEVRRSNGGKERFRLLFGKPDDSLHQEARPSGKPGGWSQPPKGSSLTWPVRRYLLLQFAVACLVVFFLLYQDAQLAWSGKACCLFYAFTLFYGIGRLLDLGLARCWRQEVWRHLSYVLAILLLVAFGGLAPIWGIGCFLAASMSGWWYWVEYTRQVPMV